VPVLVALAPPEVLQAAPELVRLLDAANFLAARGFGFGSELLDDTAERGLEALGGCSLFAPNGAEELTPKGVEELEPNGEAGLTAPSMGTIEASGLAV
jgi:hypothetical protein